MAGPDSGSKKRPQIRDKSVGTHSGCPRFSRRFEANFCFCCGARVSRSAETPKLQPHVTQKHVLVVSTMFLFPIELAASMLSGRQTIDDAQKSSVGQRERFLYSHTCMEVMVSATQARPVTASDAPSWRPAISRGLPVRFF